MGYKIRLQPFFGHCWFRFSQNANAICPLAPLDLLHFRSIVAPSARPWRHLLSMTSADFHFVRARVQKFLSRIQGRANIFETKSDAEDCVEIRLAVRK